MLGSPFYMKRTFITDVRKEKIYVLTFKDRKMKELDKYKVNCNEKQMKYKLQWGSQDIGRRNY